MMIQYTLTMPNVGSWNGKWSGEGNLYARVRTYRSKAAYESILAKGHWHYSFGDGWGANVSAKQIDGPEARKVRNNTRGFCGYEWMIDSIEKHGKIVP